MGKPCNSAYSNRTLRVQKIPHFAKLQIHDDPIATALAAIRSNRAICPQLHAIPSYVYICPFTAFRHVFASDVEGSEELGKWEKMMVNLIGKK